MYTYDHKSSGHFRILKMDLDILCDHPVLFGARLMGQNFILTRDNDTKQATKIYTNYFKELERNHPNLLQLAS